MIAIVAYDATRDSKGAEPPPSLVDAGERVFLEQNADAVVLGALVPGPEQPSVAVLAGRAPASSMAARVAGFSCRWPTSHSFSGCTRAM